MSSSDQVFGRAWPRGDSQRRAAAADFLREVEAGTTHQKRLDQVRFIAG